MKKLKTEKKKKKTEKKNKKMKGKEKEEEEKKEEKGRVLGRGRGEGRREIRTCNVLRNRKKERVICRKVCAMVTKEKCLDISHSLRFLF